MMDCLLVQVLIRSGCIVCSAVCMGVVAVVVTSNHACCPIIVLLVRIEAYNDFLVEPISYDLVLFIAV